MDVQKLMNILSIAGAVAVGLPAVLHALKLFFMLIPGDQPDKAIDFVEGISEKIASVVVKFYPQASGSEEKKS